jgi:hypothetical protein
MALVGCADRAEPESFLIDKGYRGKINVIFNQTEGRAKKYESGRRVYEIPSNGVLITQFKDNSGVMDQQYFYVDSDGKREALKQLDASNFNEPWTRTRNPHEPSRDELGIFFAARVGAYGSTDNLKSLKFQAFYVSTYRELKKYHEHKYEREFSDKVMRLTGVKF